MTQPIISNIFNPLQFVKRLLALFALLVLFCVHEVRAGGTTYTWDGGGGNGNWTNATNWNTAILTNAAAANLSFSGSVQTTTTNNYAADTNIFRSIIFADGSADFTLNGNRIFLPNNIANNDTSGTHTINLDISASAGEQINTVTGGTTVINGSLVGTGGGWTINNGGQLGTAVFTGSNSYTAATTIVEGVLNIRNGAALGATDTGTTVQSGGALELQGGISVAGEALSLSSTGSGASATTGGLRNISGNNTYGGLITLGAISRINSDSGTLTLDVASGNAITGTFALTFGGAGNIAVNDIIATTTGTVTKDGAGTLTLAAANTYSGTTTLSAGTLRATTSTGALGTGALSLGGGTLELANDTGLNFARNTTVTGSTTISSERLTSGAGVTHTLGTLSIGAFTLTAGTDATVTSGTAGLTFGAATLTGAATFSVASGTQLTFSSTMGGNFAKTFTGAGNTTVSGILSGSGGVNKSGAGTLTLAAANTFTGNLAISNGAVRGISNAAALGAPTLVILAGGNLELANNTALNFAEALAVSNNATITSDRLTAGAGVTHTNDTLSIGAQTLNIAAGSNVTSGQAGAAFSGTTTLRTNGAVFSVATNAQLTLGAVSGNTFGFTVDGAGNTTIGGVIGTTTGTVSKTGAGTLTMGSAANTYGGVTTIGGGVLVAGTLANAGTSSSIGTNATVVITNGGKLHYTGASTSINRGINLAAGNGEIGVSSNAAALTISGVISNTGTLVKSGAGTLILTASNNYQGGTLLNAGTLAAGNAFAFGSGSVTLTNGTTLNLSNLSVANVLVNNGGTLTNLGTVSGAELNGGTTTIASSNSTVAEVSGTAQVTVSGVNTTITNVSGGTVSIAGTNTTLQTVEGGTLNVAGTNTTVQTLNGGSVNVTNGTTVAVQSGSSAGAIAGGGGLVKNGTNALTLSGNNTFTGGAFLNEGTLRLASTTAAGGGSITQSNGSSRLVVDTTGTLTNQMSVFYLQSLQTVTLSGAKTLNNATYDITNNTTTTESGTLSGSGGITKLGTGTLAVTASNTFTGAVDVQAGVLNLNSATGSAAGGTTSVAVATNATLLISQNNQVNNTATVSLTGGTIRTASGVSEAFGNLSVTGSGFLDFGTTSYANANTISFGTYTPSALLTINNFDFGSTLVFKSDLTSTINNSSFFAFNNGGIASSSWNGSTFTITAIPETSTYLAAAGLLAVMLWPARRPLLREARKMLGRRDRLTVLQVD